jgi:hypothetical protein
VSRGLGKLQRVIKRLVEAQGKRFRKECDRLDREASGGAPKSHFGLTWNEIGWRLYKAADRNWSHAQDRAAKRALHTLWKRGEIGRIRNPGSGQYLYMTVETYNESFSPKAGAELKASLERLAEQP